MIMHMGSMGAAVKALSMVKDAGLEARRAAVGVSRHAVCTRVVAL